MKKEKKKFRKSVFIMLVASLVSTNFLLLPTTRASVATINQDGLAKVIVDGKGFDTQGRMVAKFGSPKIDGIIDDIWKDAPVVTPKYVSGKLDTSAEFRALWDDNALYILAQVKDKNLSVQSGTPYAQDSLELFLDENNDKTHDYGIDDLHFRVNYENAQSVDAGNIERLYTKTQMTQDGYVIEARIALKSVPQNGKVLGLELQVNDAKGADRAGTINVFDSTGTAWNDTAKFGGILLTGRDNNDISGLNPYDLLSLIDSSKKLDLTNYKNANILTDSITAAKEVLAKENVTQKQIDDQYTAVKEAMDKLVLTDEAANAKQFKPVPNEYRINSTKPGTIEQMEYTVTNEDNNKTVKKMNVYLPNGYNPSDNTKKYNILYLMHGGGENETTIFGGPSESKDLKKILDNMIANGNIEPLIVVTPSFYTNSKDAVKDTAIFNKELIKYVVPMIETKYHTYAASGSLKDLKASRSHRAFGGFSMGSVTTWYTFINCLDYFKYYMPLSGDCWSLGQGNGGTKPVETAQYLATVVKNSGYKPTDYYVFCATGAKDIAYPNLKPQVDAMMKLKDSFIFSADTTKGNFYFIISPDGTHAWNWVDQYVYDILPDLFKN
ncbi:sugar-binding protein [Clostridium saccharoperbutylacetonicum]